LESGIRRHTFFGNQGGLSRHFRPDFPNGYRMFKCSDASNVKFG
jgi:hypothetical protein